MTKNNLKQKVRIAGFIAATILLLPIFLSGILGCVKQNDNASKSWQKGKSWHTNVGWKAEDYFDDPKVIALCNAIAEKDISKVEKLLAEGANANAQGKDNMTPLLWSYFAGEEFFKKMLESGADPNVVFSSSFGIGQIILPGSSIIHMAAGTSFPHYFELVMKYGGNPNLPHKGMLNRTPIFTAIEYRKINNVAILIEKGSDINILPEGSSLTPIDVALMQNSFDIALLLLKAGTNLNLHISGRMDTIELIAKKYERFSQDTTSNYESYQKIIELVKAKQL